jgi:cytochrome c oxidase subunit 2
MAKMARLRSCAPRIAKWLCKRRQRGYAAAWKRASRHCVPRRFVVFNVELAAMMNCGATGPCRAGFVGRTVRQAADAIGAIGSGEIMKIAEPLKFRRGGMSAKNAASAIGAVGASTLASAAWAGGVGLAEPGQIGFQQAVTSVAEDIHWFHDVLLMPIITLISLFVLALLAYVIWKFNEKANPTPSKTTHNTLVEVAWTIIPVIILVVIAIPSFRLLTKELEIPAADLTVKVTASQWHWAYEYPKDQAGGFSFESYMKPENEIKPENGDVRLLSVDNEAVVPINKTVVLQITAVDVIHSFIVQSFGVRVDAVPGRLNETWFKADREGIYYGQCSKICGKDHAYMPIVFRVVSEEKYQAWLADSKKKFAAAPSAVSVADAGATEIRQ